MFLMVIQCSKISPQIILLIVQFYLINMHLKIAKTRDGRHYTLILYPVLT